MALVIDLRDYFAAHAPPYPDWWARQDQWERQNRAVASGDYTEIHVSWAWHYADVMLKLRNKDHVEEEL
jgi:hypothetical protein